MNTIDFATKLIVLATAIVGLIATILGARKLSRTEPAAPASGSSPWRGVLGFLAPFGIMLFFPLFILAYMFVISLMGKVPSSQESRSEYVADSLTDRLVQHADSSAKNLLTMYRSAMLLSNTNRRDDALERVAIMAARRGVGDLALVAANGVSNYNHKDRILDSLVQAMIRQHDYDRANRAVAKISNTNHRDKAAASVLAALDSVKH